MTPSVEMWFCDVWASCVSGKKSRGGLKKNPGAESYWLSVLPWAFFLPLLIFSTALLQGTFTVSVCSSKALITSPPNHHHTRSSFKRLRRPPRSFAQLPLPTPCWLDIKRAVLYSMTALSRALCRLLSGLVYIRGPLAAYRFSWPPVTSTSQLRLRMHLNAWCIRDEAANPRQLLLRDVVVGAPGRPGCCSGGS